MKISTKGRYALRLMLDLAMDRLRGTGAHQGCGGASGDFCQISGNRSCLFLQKQGMSAASAVLRGGYRLSREPEDYTVGMIVRLTEGSLTPVECAEAEPGACSREDTCVTRKLWKELDEAIRSVVETNMTLEDLVQWQHGMDDNYYI